MRRLIPAGARSLAPHGSHLTAHSLALRALLKSARRRARPASRLAGDR